MELGYVRSIHFHKASEQEEALLKSRPGLKIYAEERGAEGIDAVIMAFRGKPGTLCIAYDISLFGQTQTEYVEVYQRLKRLKITILDVINNENSASDGVEMQKRAAASLQYVKSLRGDRKTAKRRGRKGGIGKGIVAAAKRAEIASDDVIKRMCEEARVPWRLKAEILGIDIATLRRHYKRIK